MAATTQPDTITRTVTVPLVKVSRGPWSFPVPP